MNQNITPWQGDSLKYTPRQVPTEITRAAINIRTAQSFTSPFSTKGRKGIYMLRTQKYEETLCPEDLQVQNGIRDFGVKLNPNFALT